MKPKLINAVTPKQIKLVENTWGFLLLNTQDAGEMFYKKLFEIDPTLRQLFKDDIKKQSEKLVALITFAVHKLNNIREIVADVRALGLRHKKYNVQPEHYTTVATALLYTLKKGLGAEWNFEVEEAWITVYAILSNTMMEATMETSDTM